MTTSSGGATIPEHSRDHEEVLEEMRASAKDDVDWRSGKTWSLVYHFDDDHSAFLKQAHNLFFSENALNPLAFKSLMRFESEVVRMTANLFNGGPDVVGSMTSGGTESLLLAVKTYRDKARETRPEIKRPEIVAPRTAHAAFDKACKYFDVKLVNVPVDDMFRADVAEMERRITPNTILLIGSAPSYPQGALDPIEDLGALAQKHGLDLHVDACLGGFMVPFVEKAGYPIDPFDFRVPGVTSMSADVHKYGYAAKGASTILYRTMDTFKHQFFVLTDWPGGIYASATLPGTRPGGSIAAAWAALQAIGMDGYIENARRLMETTKTLMDGIRSIPELDILGEPCIGVFAFASNDKDVSDYAVADIMERTGWHIDRQHKPICLHCMVNPLHMPIVDEFIKDLREAVAYVKAHPETALEGSAPTYGLIATMPLRGMVAKNVEKLMHDMYGAESKVPDFAEDGGGSDVPGVVLAAMRVKQKLGRLMRSVFGS